MIQRIQSLYLALAAFCCGGLIFILPVFVKNDTPVMAMSDITYLSLFAGSAILSVIALFAFKKRTLQIGLTRVNIILNFVHFGILMFMWWEQKNAANFAPGFGTFLPIAAVILLALANKGILRDEVMVKSMDRLR